MSLPSVFLSSLVWFFLWPPEEVLSLPFLLHCENGDFSILMKDSLPAEIYGATTVGVEQSFLDSHRPYLRRRRQSH
jgi:hypothetical protein